MNPNTDNQQLATLFKRIKQARCELFPDTTSTNTAPTARPSRKRERDSPADCNPGIFRLLELALPRATKTNKRMKKLVKVSQCLEAHGGVLPLSRLRKKLDHGLPGVRKFGKHLKRLPEYFEPLAPNTEDPLVRLRRPFTDEVPQALESDVVEHHKALLLELAEYIAERGGSAELTPTVGANKREKLKAFVTMYPKVFRVQAKGKGKGKELKASLLVKKANVVSAADIPARSAREWKDERESSSDNSSNSEEDLPRWDRDDQGPSCKRERDPPTDEIDRLLELALPRASSRTHGLRSLLKVSQCLEAHGGILPLSVLRKKLEGVRGLKVHSVRKFGLLLRRFAEYFSPLPQNTEDPLVTLRRPIAEEEVPQVAEGEVAKHHEALLQLLAEHIAGRGGSAELTPTVGANKREKLKAFVAMYPKVFRVQPTAKGKGKGGKELKVFLLVKKGNVVSAADIPARSAREWPGKDEGESSSDNRSNSGEDLPRSPIWDIAWDDACPE